MNIFTKVPGLTQKARYVLLLLLLLLLQQFHQITQEGMVMMLVGHLEMKPELLVDIQTGSFRVSNLPFGS